MTEQARIAAALFSVGAGTLLTLEGIEVYRRADKLFTVDRTGPYTMSAAIDAIEQRIRRG